MTWFEVFLPAKDAGLPNVTLTVEAPNWIGALRTGLKNLGESQDAIANVMCDIRADNSIHVTDVATARVFRLREVAGPSAGPSAAPDTPAASSGPRTAPPASVVDTPRPISIPGFRTVDLDSLGSDTAAIAAAPSMPPPSQAPARGPSMADKPSLPPLPPSVDATSPWSNVRDTVALPVEETLRGAPLREPAAPPPPSPFAPELSATEPLQEVLPPARDTKPVPLPELKPPPSSTKPASTRAFEEAGTIPDMPAVAAAVPPPQVRPTPAPLPPPPAPLVTTPPKATPPPARVEAKAEPKPAPPEPARTATPPPARAQTPAPTPKGRTGPVPAPTPRGTPAPLPKRTTGQFKDAAPPKSREESRPLPSDPQIGRPAPPPKEAKRRIEDAIADVFDATQDLLMTSSVSADEVAEKLLDIALAHIPADAGTFYLAKASGHELTFAAVRGPKAKELKKSGLTVPIGQGIVGFCAQEGICLSVSDIEHDARYFSAIADAIGYQPKNTLCASAEKEGRLFGAVQLINAKTPGGFDATHMEVLRYIGLTAASLLERAWDEDDDKPSARR